MIKTSMSKNDSQVLSVQVPPVNGKVNIHRLVLLCVSCFADCMADTCGENGEVCEMVVIMNTSYMYTAASAF